MKHAASSHTTRNLFPFHGADGVVLLAARGFVQVGKAVEAAEGGWLKHVSWTSRNEVRRLASLLVRGNVCWRWRGNPTFDVVEDVLDATAKRAHIWAEKKSSFDEWLPRGKCNTFRRAVAYPIIVEYSDDLSSFYLIRIRRQTLEQGSPIQ